MHGVVVKMTLVKSCSDTAVLLKVENMFCLRMRWFCLWQRNKFLQVIYSPRSILRNAHSHTHLTRSRPRCRRFIHCWYLQHKTVMTVIRYLHSIVHLNMSANLRASLEWGVKRHGKGQVSASSLRNSIGWGPKHIFGQWLFANGALLLLFSRVCRTRKETLFLFCGLLKGHEYCNVDMFVASLNKTNRE